MKTARKITVEVPQALLEKAQPATGAGITQTVRTGLQLSGSLAGVRSPAPAPSEGSLQPHRARAESRSMIAAATSTWIAFLQGSSGEMYGNSIPAGTVGGDLFESDQLSAGRPTCVVFAECATEDARRVPDC